MDRRGPLLIISILTLSLGCAYAIPAGFELKTLPAKKDFKKYENRTYQTPQEYLSAFQAGRCSSVWVWMHMERDDKIATVDNLKKACKEKGRVVINKPTEFYVDELDNLIARDPYAGNYKIGVLFKTIAVIEYDFDEGIDKELTAKRWLGPLYPILKESQKDDKQK